LTTLRSRFRAARKDEGTRKPEGDVRRPIRLPNGDRIREVNRSSGPGRSGPCSPAIVNGRGVTEVVSEA